MIAVGAVLAGKFRVDRVIGQGGMGVVVAATHLHLQQPVALKFLLPDLVHSPQIVERFVREARASAQLRGEHVCRVSDVGAFDHGAPYIVMELLEGSDLASLLASHGPLPVPLAADYVLQACVGIAEAHAGGIVHRDLKPANLFLTRRPDGSPLIKVLDFGIAKATGDRNFSLTQTSAVLGSPGYMSPEQLRSTRDVDVRSDIWSLGVILYELVSGRPPFTGESITELALHIAMDPTPPLVGRMPHGFDQVVHRCLEKDAAQRYPDLANLAHALAAYGGAGSWDMASAVSRLLNVAPPQSASSSHAAYAAATVRAPITPPFAQPQGQSLGQPRAPHTTPPTTMGGAASSMVMPPARRGARWGVVVGAALAAIAGIVVTAIAMRGGTAPSPSATEAVAKPVPAALDAGAPEAVPAADPPPKATIDAAVPPPTPTPPPPPAPPAPIDAGVPDAPRPSRPRPSKPKPADAKDDIGESRF
ncbi:MAG TPA: protein kinase [Kofleriaceae bacterium]|nr:protein kinase [Kofleriaceae bacterium]